MTAKAVVYDWLGWNAHLFFWINGSLPDALRGVARLGSALGNYWAAPLPLAALLWWSRRTPDEGARVGAQRQAFVFAAGFLLAFGLAAVLKWTLNLPRPATALGAAVRLLAPEEAGHSFPSGHSMYAALLAAAVWPLVGAMGRLGLVLYVLWVACSRVALGAHFPADIAGAWLLALLCAGAAKRVWSRLPKRRLQNPGLVRFSRK